MINSCIPTANSLFNIVVTNKKVKLHHYNDVLPLPAFGDSVCYNSPLADIHFRKMIYFVINKATQTAKDAVILPFVNDHFVMFNTRENLTSMCNFSSKVNFKTHTPDIINIHPVSQNLYRYALNGQLL